MNKKYQMLVDNIQANLYNYDQNDTDYFSLSRTVAIFCHSVISCRGLVGKLKWKQIGPSISSWLLVLLLQTEARPRPNV